MLMQIKRRRNGTGGIPSGIKMRTDVYVLYVYVSIPRLSSEDVKNRYKNENFTTLKEEYEGILRSRMVMCLVRTDFFKSMFISRKNSKKYII